MKIRHLSIKLRLVLKKFILELRQSHIRDLRNKVFLYLKKLPDVTHLRNLILISTILSFIIFVLFVQRFNALGQYYEKKTPLSGGVYTEGVVGQVEKINPLFVQNEAEDTANRLIFSGLTREMPDGEVIPDLAEKWTVENNGNAYTFELKKNLKWHDGEDLNADDILFTINLIQNPDTRTGLSSVWQGVVTEKVDEQTIKFVLPNVYSDFLKTASQPILPEHLLKETDPSNIKIAEYNLKPIGSGPYRFIRFDQTGNETVLVLEANKNFLPHEPYIKTVRIRMYDTFANLYNGVLRKQVNSISRIPYDKTEDVKKLGSMTVYNFYMPRYRVMLFNMKNPLLASKDLRLALSKAINRNEIIDKGLSGKAMPVYAPILPGEEGYSPTLNVNNYNPALANEALEKLGWAKGQDGIRQKGETGLKFRLALPGDSESKKTAEMIKEQFQAVGVEVELVISDEGLFQADYIRPRNFDIILVGQNVGEGSDLYSFWHSTQVNDPGLNLTGYSDRKTDKLIELGRKSNDVAYKSDKYKQAEETIMAEAPGIFLYNPLYSIAVTNNIKNFYQGHFASPVDHLNNIASWHIHEKVTK